MESLANRAAVQPSVFESEVVAFLLHDGPVARSHSLSALGQKKTFKAREKNVKNVATAAHSAPTNTGPACTSTGPQGLCVSLLRKKKKKK